MLGRDCGGNIGATICPSQLFLGSPGFSYFHFLRSESRGDYYENIACFRGPELVSAVVRQSSAFEGLRK